MKTFILAMLFIFTASNVIAAEDWTYELSSEAKQIYSEKIIQYPCENIPELLRQGNAQDLYYTIRDAGLFKTESCGAIIQKHVDSLNQMRYVKDAVAFYLFRLGDKEKLKILAVVFGKEAKTISDHWVVDLFGYLDDWDISGVRLVRHAAYSDASGSEVLCSALTWRRFLYGEKNFKDNWYSVGKKENVDKRRLDHFYETCRVEP